MKSIALFTAISCKGPVPQNGACAAVLCYKNAQRETATGLSATKSSRLEILAIIKGLEMLKEPCEVTVHLSNQNLINTFESGWIEGWIKRGLFAQTGGKIKNKDLLLEVYGLVQKHKALFTRYTPETIASVPARRAKALALAESEKPDLPADVETHLAAPQLLDELEENGVVEYSEEELKDMQREKSARGAWHSRNIAEVTELFSNTCQRCGTHPPHKRGVAHHLSYPPEYWLIPTPQKVEAGIITFLCRDCHQKAHTAATYEEYLEDKLKHSAHCQRCDAFVPKAWKVYNPRQWPLLLCAECAEGLRDGRLVVAEKENGRN